MRSQSSSEHAVVLADQAGSGKTLAYLLPLLQLLRTEEAQAGGKRLTQPSCPRVIIAAPTVGEAGGCTHAGLLIWAGLGWPDLGWPGLA